MRLKICFLAAVWALVTSLGVYAETPVYSLGGGIGVSQIDQEFYLTTSVVPDLAIGKLGVGLELTLNFNQDGIRVADWDTAEKSIARSIRYIRWAHKGDPFYVQFGSLYDAEIGTGILVDNYMNASTADISSGNRHLGLAMDVDFTVGGVEALVNDTLQPSVYAGRLYVRPASVIPFLSSIKPLTMGVSLAIDKRSDSPYNSLSATAVDAYYPISRAFVLYAHRAEIAGHGAGQGMGIKGTVGPISYMAEARKYDSDFVSSPFSKSYEETGIDWSQYPADGTPIYGYVLGADLNLMNGDLVVSVTEELNRADTTHQTPRITGELSAKGQMLKWATGGRDAEVGAAYTKELIDPASGDANGYLKAHATLSIFRGVGLNYQYNVVYPYGGEPQRHMTAGLSFGM